MGKLFILLVLFSAYFGYKIKTSLFSTSPLPPKLDEIWWGPGTPGSIKSVVKPFTISVPDSVSAFSHYFFYLPAKLNNHIVINIFFYFGV